MLCFSKIICYTDFFLFVICRCYQHSLWVGLVSPTDNLWSVLQGCYVFLFIFFLHHASLLCELGKHQHYNIVRLKIIPPSAELKQYLSWQKQLNFNYMVCVFVFVCRFLYRLSSRQTDNLFWVYYSVAPLYIFGITAVLWHKRS